jgi:hypothetical protein
MWQIKKFFLLKTTFELFFQLCQVFGTMATNVGIIMPISIHKN